MPGGSRRLGLGIGLLVIALFSGRWLSLFLTARLWEAQVSEAAAVVGTRWAILRAGLETGGVVLAAAWFVVNFLAAARVALPPGRELPGLAGRLAHPARRWLVVGAALVLGIGVGRGSGRWVERLLLALHGVRYDATDTLFHVDLGLFVAGFPLWRLLYRRAIAVVAPALLGVLLIHTLGGTLRVDQRRLWLAPRARLQLALLLSVAALVLGWGLALQPFRLAATQSAELGPSEFILRTTVAELEAVFAATAGVLSFLWGLRMRFVVALGGWVGFGIALLAGEILVASRSGDTTPSAALLAPLRPVDTIAFALRRGGPQDLAPPGPGRPLELGPSL